MPPKRRKHSPAPDKGLAPGESLARYLIPNKNAASALWAWVGSEVSHPQHITSEHRQMACGLSPRNEKPFCSNKYVIHPTRTTLKGDQGSTGGYSDDIIVISDTEHEVCNKKACKDNPNCLNYLGQDKWERNELVMKQFLKAAEFGSIPEKERRNPDIPIGLKNLGATCYANASLQVWFRNLRFRDGVYQCQPIDGTGANFKDSPLFHLQATFAALQDSARNVFNPLSLVESLQLRASEQQDAQEFSKLFISHLDAEFRKQPSHKLRTLVTEQFQGSQVYGTICHKCSYRSERSADFLEIEIRFEANSTLQDCIQQLLQEERLSDDNQYHCPRCDNLQDATRYTELRQLPPVLHFSLLRFVYDFDTMDRKKSKNLISFPTTLDMSPYLKVNGVHIEGEEYLYELQGVLLHKGASAYHGHYEAQVYDFEKQSWFQFNDEAVTRIKTLGDTKSSNEETKEDDATTSTKKAKRPPRKKRRVVSDDEPEPSKPSKPATMISSRDAYMLVYVRKGEQWVHQREAPKAPQEAFHVVKELNESYEAECQAFERREQEVGKRFHSLRKNVMSIYQTWNTSSPNEDCLIFSQQWLNNWLTKGCVDLAKPSSIGNEDNKTTDSGIIIKEIIRPDDDVLCMHNKLDPNKAKNMKRIKRDAYNEMCKITGYKCEPLLSPSDVCEECIAREFKEYLYNIEHHRSVKEFDEISEAETSSQRYWISKKWLKDWRLSKPKMHRAVEEDPSPDSDDYRDDIYCEHGGLSLNPANRVRIFEEAVQLLQRIYPAWNPAIENLEPCAVCDAMIHRSKEDKRELKRQAEQEKTSLVTLFEEVPFSETEDSFALISSYFYREWLAWITNPTALIRSDRIDNSMFLCEHGLFVYNPNCPLDRESMTIIRRSDWDVLNTLYVNSGPLIIMEKVPQSDVFQPHIPICECCLIRRKTEWDTADIFIQLCGKQSDPKHRTIPTYSNKNNTRQSKRLRQARDNKKQKFTITSMTTVKDIKVKINEGFNIPTICQRLFFRGQELDDNEVTVAMLKMAPNEVLEVREQGEVHELGSDSDEGHQVKKQREAERGFGGTLLSAEHEHRQFSHSREDSPHSGFSQPPTEKICTACTLVNPYDALACTICDTAFE